MPRAVSLPPLRSVVALAVDNFGPLIVFLAVDRLWGLKPAIAASVAFSAFEIARKLSRGEPTTLLFRFTAAMTLVFGTVDLYAQRSFLFKYEACATNVLTGFFFGATLLDRKSILQEYYEKRPDAKPLTADRVVYFRWLTVAWVVYFLVKAAVYLWLARTFSLERAAEIRSTAGAASFYAMLFVSIAGSKKIFPAIKRLGLLPDPGAETAG